jgi:deazaflavin-dependent oxidoreductase (nitroreductase family)
MAGLDGAVADGDYCYLTTSGRVSGRPHTIEIWFGLVGETLYMLSGGGERSDWVRNLRREPLVDVRLGERHVSGRARVLGAGEEDARARVLLVEKYQPRYSGDLTEWGRSSLPVAVDLDVAADEEVRG